MPRAIASVLVVACLLGVSATAEEKKPTVKFKEFTAFEVENFENPKMETKEPMPDAWIPTLREDVQQRVIGLHKFPRVADFTDPKVTKPDAERVLLLKGKVIEFSQGSQAARYLIGFGAGKGKIVVMCQFIDKATGQVVWERKRRGASFGCTVRYAFFWGGCST